MKKPLFAVNLALAVLFSILVTQVDGFPIYSHAVALFRRSQAVQQQLNVVTKATLEFMDRMTQAQKTIEDQLHLHRTADFIQKSIVFCGHHNCGVGPAFYRQSKDACFCPRNGPIFNDYDDAEDLVHPHADCTEKIECVLPRRPVFKPEAKTCVCAVGPFPNWEHTDGVEKTPCKEDFEHRAKELKRIAKEYSEETSYLCSENATSVVHQAKIGSKLTLQSRQDVSVPGAVPLAPLPTFVPPPKTDITPALIQQSLSVQPQKDAIVHSAIPYFGDGVITFHVQLNGPVPQTLQLNSTDSMVCDTIGTKPDPNLMLVPRSVRNGTEQVTVPNCLIIAVNKYNASWINYWVQKTDGSGAIFSLLGDAKIHDIDQLDPSKPAALQIVVASQYDSMKRHVTGEQGYHSLKRHQVVHEDTKFVDMSARAVETPDSYTAVMTPQACAAMTCINNGNQAALFNPFSKTCWCTAPTYIDVNPSAHGQE